MASPPIGVYSQLFEGPWGLLRGGPGAVAFPDPYQVAVPFQILTGADYQRYAYIMGLSTHITPAYLKAAIHELRRLGLIPTWERRNSPQGPRTVVIPFDRSTDL